jgi:cysteine desulfurase/selenocysteine lyase
VTHISNVTGALLPVERIVELAHAPRGGNGGALVLIDGCQAVPRLPVGSTMALACTFCPRAD